MRTLIILAALLLAPAASAETLEDLHWLKGCWRTHGGASVITEVWAAPPMPAMLGYAYTVRDGQLRDWEQMRIEMAEGVATFVAMPRGGAPVRFRAVERSSISRIYENAGGVSFANAEHDFPQRVSYIRLGDTLQAEISNLDGTNAITFSYRRIRCPGELRP